MMAALYMYKAYTRTTSYPCPDYLNCYLCVKCSLNNLSKSRTTKIPQNLPKYIQNPLQSIKIHQNPLKILKIYSKSTKINWKSTKINQNPLKNHQNPLKIHQIPQKLPVGSCFPAGSLVASLEHCFLSNKCSFLQTKTTFLCIFGLSHHINPVKITQKPPTSTKIHSNSPKIRQKPVKIH